MIVLTAVGVRQLALQVHLADRAFAFFIVSLLRFTHHRAVIDRDMLVVAFLRVGMRIAVVVPGMIVVIVSIVIMSVMVVPVVIMAITFDMLVGMGIAARTATTRC